MTARTKVAQEHGVRSPFAAGPCQPQLAVAWEPRWRNLASNVGAALLGQKTPREIPAGAYFNGFWMGSRLRWRALLASALWHVAIVVFPFSLFPFGERRPTDSHPLSLPRIELTWYGSIGDLPPLDPAGPLSHSSARRKWDAPRLRRGADAFHPRQAILSASPRLTHPRQTLIRPDAPPTPPKLLPQLPNIVLWAGASQPIRPPLQINRSVLAGFHSKKTAPGPPPELPLPDVPKFEPPVGELNLASHALAVPKPRLRIVPVMVAQAGPRLAAQAVGPVPDLRPNVNRDLAGGNGSIERLVALSARPPVPPPENQANLPVPLGNLSSRFLISPDGAQNHVAGDSADGGEGATRDGSGSGPPGVSIRGGAAPANSLLSNPGRDFLLARPFPARPQPAPPPDPSPEVTRTPPAPGWNPSNPGGSPNQIFGDKRVYTLYVNMPNLASATGSWVLSFVEVLPADHVVSAPAAPRGELSGPVPLRKVDPRYPPTLMENKVEGEVVLYAVIRKDGSVDSIQLLRGIEPQLDSNAMSALGRWKFHPAERQGAPVELEAIVHIPFRAVAPAY